MHTPWLGIVPQGLQPCLDQIQRLEEQRGAGATERATHKGFESWVGLKMESDDKRQGNGKERTERGDSKKKWQEAQRVKRRKTWLREIENTSKNAKYWYEKSCQINIHYLKHILDLNLNMKMLV